MQRQLTEAAVMKMLTSSRGSDAIQMMLLEGKKEFSGGGEKGGRKVR
jgi:hypothetical protein